MNDILAETILLIISLIAVWFAYYYVYLPATTISGVTEYMNGFRIDFDENLAVLQISSEKKISNIKESTNDPNLELMFDDNGDIIGMTIFNVKLIDWKKHQDREIISHDLREVVDYCFDNVVKL